MDNEKAGGLGRYISKTEAWALSIGCAVGWGAFVMPGTTFLPLAGPVGTALGMLVGAAVMLIIGVNYHFLMNKYPDAGGTLTYSIRAFGYDHGLLSAWFLILVYIAIMWANATAIVLIARNLFGQDFQWGFQYKVAGYDIFMGEVILTLFVIVIFGLICMHSKRLAIVIQTIMAMIMVGGVLCCAFMVLAKGGGAELLNPPFSPQEMGIPTQVLEIAMLSPWAFVGFESISNSTQGFKFSPKKSLPVMAWALVGGAACYILLAFIASCARPEGVKNWVDYLDRLDSMSGYASIPTFYSVHTAMGETGIAILGITVTAGIVTGLVGNYIAASRLMYAMCEDGILPEWFGRLNKDGNPSNAVCFLMLLSLFVPFVGRAAIGWIVDVTTIGALIAYAYTSAAAFKLSKEDGKTGVRITGMTGLVLSLLSFYYFMVPNAWLNNALSTESYLILIIWSIIGLFFFRLVYSRDTQNRFGKSSAVWLVLLFIIFFTSMLWLREAAQDSAKRVLKDLNYYNTEELSEHNVVLNDKESLEAQQYLEEKMDEVSGDMVRNSWMQLGVIFAALVIMLNIYRAMMQRENRIEMQKIKAEESSRAKSSFLSNMSHDIRTPMNAIIGYTTLAKKEKNVPPEIDAYLTKIEASGRHLLTLINDVLDLSRIENGKMELEPESMNIVTAFDEMKELFAAQMGAKSINYKVDCAGVVHKMVICDNSRLERVLLNLISNACKYTPDGGRVSVTLKEEEISEKESLYVISVKDTGIGMSPEFAATVFEEYSRDKSAASIQGTGLGMAITKSIIDLMGGTIEVKSEEGKGSEFIISLKLELSEEPELVPEKAGDEAVQSDFSGMRLLLVDDNAVNREIAAMILKEYGFELDTAENGKIALDMVSATAPGYYRAILMDVQMPVMGGYEATRAIRALDNAERASVPVIAMTANAFTEDINEAKEAGMNAHVAKPIDVAQLIQTLKEVLK